MARETAVITIDIMQLTGRSAEDQARIIGELGIGETAPGHTPDWLSEFKILGQLYEALRSGRRLLIAGEEYGLKKIRTLMGGDEIMPPLAFLDG